MSNTRTHELHRLAEMFKALSNPNRLSVFIRLISCCRPENKVRTDEEVNACVGELGRDLGIAASTVSHHIKELRRAGLIHMERRGQKVECWVNPETLQNLAEFFNGR